MIKPYLFALAPAPLGDTVAAICLLPGEELPTLVIDGSNGRVSFPFSQFETSGLAWDADGRKLAGFHGASFFVFVNGAGLTIHRAEQPITAVGFLGDEALFSCGRKILALASNGDEVQQRAAHVIDVAFSRKAVWLHVEDGTHRIERWEPDGQIYHWEWPLPGERTPTMSCSDDGRWLVCGAVSIDSQWPAADLMLALVDARSELPKRLPGVRIDAGLGASRVPLAVTSSGEVVVQLVVGGCSRLLRATEGTIATMSPDDLDIQEFALHPDGRSFATVASAIGGHGAPRMSLVVSAIPSSDAPEETMREVAGSFDMLRWSSDGRLFCAKAHRGGWRRVAVDIASGRDRRSRRDHAVPDFGLFHLAGPPDSKRLLVMLASPHRLLRAGPQTLFFQHALYSMAIAAGELGYHVLGVNGPGSSGGGSEWRYPDGNLAGAWATVFGQVAMQFRNEGCEQIGLLAGSLGAYLGIGVMRLEALFDRAALISPVISSKSGALRTWPSLLDAVQPARDQASTSRLFVAYGSEDPLTTSEEVEQLQKTFSREGRSIVLSQEGHIFRQPSSWRTVTTEMLAFLCD